MGENGKCITLCGETALGCEVVLNAILIGIDIQRVTIMRTYTDPFFFFSLNGTITTLRFWFNCSSQNALKNFPM